MGWSGRRNTGSISSQSCSDGPDEGSSGPVWLYRLGTLWFALVVQSGSSHVGH